LSETQPAIDLRRFAAKHAVVALSANLASKDFVQIAANAVDVERDLLRKIIRAEVGGL